MPGYTTTAPAPTAAPLTIIERANTSSAPSGGGGGGGGSLSSITVSTIGFPAANLQQNQAVITMTDKLFFTDFQPQQGSDFTMSCGDQSAVPGSVSTANAFVIFSPQDNQTYLALESLSTQTNIVSRNITGPGATGVPLNVIASAVNMSSLNVSSINGVVPGGAVIPGDLALSTLTMGIPGGITAISSLEGVGSVLPIVGTLDVLEIKTVSSINGAVYPPAGGGALSTFNQLFTSTIECLNPASQNLVITGNNNNLVVDLETPLVSRLRFSPSTSIGNGGGQGPFIKVEDQANGNYTLSIQSDAAPALTTSISSLNVSSINGTAYPPAGASLQFSSIGIPGGPGTSSFVCDPGATNILVSFSTISTHIYSAWVLARAQSFDAAANGDLLISEILDDTTGQEAIGSWPLQSISTQSAGSAYQYIGGCVNWKAGGTGTAFSVVPNQSSFVRVDAINLIDFGAI